MVFFADKTLIVLVDTLKAEFLHGGGCIHRFHLLMSYGFHLIVGRQTK